MQYSSRGRMNLYVCIYIYIYTDFCIHEYVYHIVFPSRWDLEGCAHRSYHHTITTTEVVEYHPYIVGFRV